MDRRQLFGGSIAALLGWLGLSKAQEPESPKGIKGFIAFRINVGCLPPHKAEAFIERLKAKFHASLKDKKLHGWETVWMPVRDGVSQTQVFLVNEDGSKEIEPFLLDFYQHLDKTWNEQVDENRQQIENYILMMLGAPVVKVELDQQQIDLCIDSTIKDIDAHATRIDGLSSRAMHLVKRGSLARAKLILGRIRSKHPAYPGPNGPIKLDGKMLCKEGKEELRDFYDQIQTL